VHLLEFIRYTLNNVYKTISENIYSTPYTGGITSPSDDLTYPFDSYDLCLENYSYIFDGVNNAITDTVLRHVYNFWPVAGTQDSVDPASLQVIKSSGQIIQEVPLNVTIVRDANGVNDVDSNGAPVNGYRYVGNQTNQNTKFAPLPAGEPFTGKMIELFGTAKVTWPEYITVNSTAEREYLGFCHIPTEPDEPTITVRINGQLIPQGGPDGWTLLKTGSGAPLFEQNKNIRIQSPTNFAPATPAVLKTGYFVSLSGNAIYSNSIACEVDFIPSAR